MEQIISCDYYSTDISPEVWQEIRPFIEQAARYAHWEFTPEDTLEALADDSQQAWVVRADGDLKFVWITEVLQQSGRKIVIVLAAAGEMKYGWVQWPWMSQWMIGNDITEAEVFCRPSVARLLKRYGLKPKYEVLSIEPVRIP